MSKKTKSTKSTSAKTTTKPADPDRVPLSVLDKQKKTAKAKKPSGLDAAAQILKDTGQPMRCKDLVQTMLAKGLWTTEGKTPSATIYSAILREIAHKADKSRFKKTDRGLFAYNA